MGKPTVLWDNQRYRYPHFLGVSLSTTPKKFMRCNYSLFFVFPLLLFASLQLEAQVYYKPYHLFSIRDGLAQQQVRAFLEDSRGFVWIGTNAGLSRFDGRSLQSYPSQQGFAGKQVYAILEALDGAIWYRSADTVYAFDGRRERTLPMTNSFWQAQPPYLWPLITLDIRKRLGQRYPEIRALGDSYTLFTDTAGAAIVIDWEKRLCHRFLDRCSTTPLPKDFPRIGIEDYTYSFLICHNNYYTWTPQGLQCVARYLPGPDSVQVLHPLAPSVFNYNNHVVNHFWYRDGNQYHRIELGKFNRLDKIVLDRQRRLHIATDEGYAVMYPYGPEWVELPQATYPWSVLTDSHGSLWIGSNKDGIVQLLPGNSHTILHPMPTDDNIHQIFPGKLSGPGGAMLFGGYKGFYHLKKGQPVLFNLNEPVEALSWDVHRQCYWVAGTSLYGIDPRFERVVQTLSLPSKVTLGAGLSDLEVAGDGSIWVAGRGGILHLGPDGTEKQFYGVPGRSNCLWIDVAGMLWIGSQKGLFFLDQGSDQFVAAAGYLTNNPVNNLVPLPDHYLAVVTDTELLLLDIHQQATPILKGYWAEKNGFQLLEACDNGACFDGTNLWIPAGNGIQRINLANQILKPMARPGLRLESIHNEPMAFSQMAPEQIVKGNTVEVVLNLINLNAGDFSLSYSLNGGEWQKAKSQTTVYVVGLEQGSNTLLFRAEIPMIAASEWPYVQASVQAELPIMQRTFIQWLFWGGGILLIGFFINSWLKEKKEKKLRALLHKTQLSTVQAQLNPHILFNLLSSLQNSITNRDKMEASEHLVRIARLIREILELSIAPAPNARYPFPTISLRHEIRFLDNYLQLESMQHTPNFKYEIRNEVTTDPERIFIPPLLVQPLAENAVIHGIKPQAGKASFIRIIFREDGDDLVISVEDDGAGPSGASGARSVLFRHRSRGGELLQKRLYLMGKLGFPAKWLVELRPEGGTVAEIRIRKIEDLIQKN